MKDQASADAVFQEKPGQASGVVLAAAKNASTLSLFNVVGASGVLTRCAKELSVGPCQEARPVLVQSAAWYAVKSENPIAGILDSARADQSKRRRSRVIP